MEKMSQRFQQRLTKLEEKIENLLIMDADEEHEKIAAQNFECSVDQKLIRTLSRDLPEDIDDRAIIVFSRLSLFFEVGILFEKDSTWKAQAYFSRGRIYPLLGEGLHVRGGPEISALQIVKAPALPFLKQLKIDREVPNPNDLTAFLLRPFENISLILMTRLAGPWLKVHMDEIHQEVLKAFI